MYNVPIYFSWLQIRVLNWKIQCYALWRREEPCSVYIRKGGAGQVKFPGFSLFSKVGYTASSSGRMGWLCGASSRYTASMRASTGRSPRGPRLTSQMCSNAFQLLLYKVSTCITHVAVTFLTWAVLTKSTSFVTEDYRSL